MQVVRHASADSFWQSAEKMPLRDEAENNLIIGIAQGIAKNPSYGPTRS